MKKVLIAGASGYLGKFVIKEFKKQGYWVRAISRNSNKLKEEREFIDDEFIADVTNKSTLNNCCEGVDVVFSSVGITKQKDGLTYMDVDFQANKNLLDEAKRSAVKKFIYISVFCTEKMHKLKCIQAKLKFEEELKNSGLDYTIIYPNGFFSDMMEYLEMAKKGKGIVYGLGENKINPIHGADLAEVCVNSAQSNQTEIKVGGPEVLTHNEIFEIAFDLLNKKPKISRFPVWMKGVLLSLARTFTSVKTYGPLEFFITVISTDMIAPKYGKLKLEDFFWDNLDYNN